MSRNWIFHNAFEEIPFSSKVNKSYGGWCFELLKYKFSNKFYKSFKNDISYYRQNLVVKGIINFLLILFWISSLILFPIYAGLLKLYWSKQYTDTFNQGEEPISAIMVSSVSNPIYNGLKAIKVLEEHKRNGESFYKLLLENKEIVNFSESELIFKNNLLVKKDKLEHGLKNIEHLLKSFEPKEESA